MSTGVLEPVADPRPADGGAPARRAVVRWAWRLTEHAMREFHIQATTNDWLVQGTSPSLLPRSPGAELTAEQLAERGDRRARHHPRRGHLLLIVLGMPALAAIVGWLFAGREPAAMAHQAIE